MRYGDVESGQLRRALRQQAELNAAGERKVALHALLMQQIAMELGVFESECNVIGDGAEQIFVRFGERPTLFVQQLQHADGLVALAENGQAQKRFGAVAEAQIDFRFEARICVGVFEIHGFAMLRHPSRDAFTDRQANFVLVEAQANQRPDFVAFVIDEKNGAAFRAGVPGGELQNNVQEFGEVEGGIEALGGLDDGGKLDHRMPALAAFEGDLGVAAEKIHPAPGVSVQLAFGLGFENSHRMRTAAKYPGGAVTVGIGIFAVQDSFDMTGIGGLKFPAFLPDYGRAVHHAPQTRAFKTAGRSENADHLRSELAGVRFRIQGGYDLLERIERKALGFGWRAGRGLACHPRFPLYSMTRMVMSSDCAAPSVNTRMPSRMASPSCCTVSPVKFSIMVRKRDSSNNSFIMLLASETPSV